MVTVGSTDGTPVGVRVGYKVGDKVGFRDGDTEGCNVGGGEGSLVGTGVTEGAGVVGTGDGINVKPITSVSDLCTKEHAMTMPHGVISWNGRLKFYCRYAFIKSKLLTGWTSQFPPRTVPRHSTTPCTYVSLAPAMVSPYKSVRCTAAS